jgi:hypothetical protein
LPCRGIALAEGNQCHVHCRRPVAAQRRLRKLEQVAGDNASPADAEQLAVRMAANRLRVEWRRNPWSHGQTLDLADDEVAFRDALLAAACLAGRYALEMAPRVHGRRRLAGRVGGGAPAVAGAGIGSGATTNGLAANVGASAGQFDVHGKAAWPVVPP